MLPIGGKRCHLLSSVRCQVETMSPVHCSMSSGDHVTCRLAMSPGDDGEAMPGAAGPPRNHVIGRTSRERHVIEGESSQHVIARKSRESQGEPRRHDVIARTSERAKTSRESDTTTQHSSRESRDIWESLDIRENRITSQDSTQSRGGL